MKDHHKDLLWELKALAKEMEKLICKTEKYKHDLTYQDQQN